MRPPTAQVVESYPAGYWRVYARPFGQARTDITFVRGAKTKVASLTTTDPFGPAAGQLVFPTVSYLDALGSGDLAWCIPNVDIDVVWTTPEYTATDDDGEPYTVGQVELYTWEGYAAEWDFSETEAAGSLTIPLIGALKQADNYLAKPEYLYQPLPYEAAITQALDDAPDRRYAAARGMVRDAAKPILGWATPVLVPAPAGSVVLAVTQHGYDVKDTVRVIGAAGAKGTVNNGTFQVTQVPDANHLVIYAPKAAVAGRVSAKGLVIRERSSMFPDWWTKTYDSAAYPPAQPWLIPSAVSQGQKWTGMLTRDTGKFDAVLSNYVQGLLSNMHTQRGQFTLLLAKGRVPYLTHRDHKHAPDGSTLVVDALWPGVKITPRVDHTQQIGVIYAQGKATNGDVYTGMQVTSDGSRTWYDPTAYRRQVHPQAQNAWLDRSVMRREVMLNFSDGLDEAEAQRASRDHLQRFSDPGVTASITLTTDPRFALTVDADGNVSGDTPFPRQTLQAGMSLQVKGLFGRTEGVLFHITEATVNDDSSVSLTVDSLYRDHLTVDQVRKRGHDSLVPYRMLSTTGTFDPRIPDLLYPWSYAAGAGVMPFTAAPLFKTFGPNKVKARGLVADPYAIPFPWTEYTTAYPPKSNPKFYMRVRPADLTNANNNWANRYDGVVNTLRFKPHYLHLAAAGEIKLLQIAAYDANGNVKAVPFHVSLYYQQVSYSSMPMIPQAGTRLVTRNATVTVNAGSNVLTVTHLPKGHGIIVGEQFYVDIAGASVANGTWTAATVSSTGLTASMGALTATVTHSNRAVISDPQPGPSVAGYDAGQHYPFFPQAWEKILPDGRTPTFIAQVGVASQSPIMYGVGTYYEKAGYWPGSSSDGDRPTGMFADESGFPFDFRGLASGVDVRKTAAQNQAGKLAPLRITAFVMVYCDADPDQPTFFLGRCFRKEYQG